MYKLIFPEFLEIKTFDTIHMYEKLQEHFTAIHLYHGTRIKENIGAPRFLSELPAGYIDKPLYREKKN